MGAGPVEGEVAIVDHFSDGVALLAADAALDVAIRLPARVRCVHLHHREPAPRPNKTGLRGFRVEGLGFGVEGLGLGFMVWGAGFGV